MGAYAGIYTEKWKKFISVFRYENFVVYLICFLCVAYRMVHSARFNPAKSGYEINFNLSAPLSPLMTVFAISAIILIYYLAQNFLSSKNFLQSTLYSFGKYSFGGYLIHPLLLIASFASTKMIADLSVRMAAAFVLCAILSLFSTILVSRIPFIGTVFVGKIRRK
jgi:membrane-bound acyltransferase YfiQ involved in biofilm formation